MSPILVELSCLSFIQSIQNHPYENCHKLGMGQYDAKYANPEGKYHGIKPTTNKQFNNMTEKYVNVLFLVVSYYKCSLTGKQPLKTDFLNKHKYIGWSRR